MKSGITSNVDNKLTPEQREATRKLDDLENKIDDHIRDKTKDMGTEGYQYLGAYGRNSSTLTEAHLRPTLDSYMTRRARNEPVKPAWTMFTEDGDPVWILNDVDAEAARLGYICPNCLEWQKDPITLKCENNNGFSCEYTRSD